MLSRDSDVLVSTGSIFFKPEMDTGRHKKIYILRIKRSCWLQKYLLFLNRSKTDKFGKNMHFLHISVRHFEYLMSCYFHQKVIQARPVQKLGYSEILIKSS